MSRESCIMHRAKQAIAIVRQDYYELMDRDACAAALLNVFEYWANAAIAVDSSTSNIERPWVGARPIHEFEQMLLGIATDKQIRKRLSLLEARGFIRMRAPAKRGAAKAYQVLIPEIQQALVGQMTQLASDPRSNNRYCSGHLTGSDNLLRSNNQQALGHLTNSPSVKQPILLRSNDRALKNTSKEFKKEDLRKDSKEARLSFSKAQQSAFEKTTFEQAEGNQTSIKQNGLEQPKRRFPVRKAEITPTHIGLVCYTQPPETIDLADLWESNPGMAKSQMRFLAPGHKRLEMVAHRFGHWWIGPGLNDFDELLIKACQQRKRKLEQPDSIADAKTFINNMLRKGDWANFSLRCDEAKALRDRALVAQSAAIKTTAQPTNAGPSAIADIGRTQLARTRAEQRQSAIGLARFKVGRGEITRAKEIADHLGIAYSDIGISAHIRQPMTA